MYGIRHRLGGFMRDLLSLPRTEKDDLCPLPRGMRLLPPSNFLSLNFFTYKTMATSEQDRPSGPAFGTSAMFSHLV